MDDIVKESTLLLEEVEKAIPLVPSWKLVKDEDGAKLWEGDAEGWHIVTVSLSQTYFDGAALHSKRNILLHLTGHVAKMAADAAEAQHGG